MKSEKILRISSFGGKKALAVAAFSMICRKHNIEGFRKKMTWLCGNILRKTCVKITPSPRNTT